MEAPLGMFIAMFDAVVVISIVLVAMLAAYLGHRVIHGIRAYFRFRGTRPLTCPETHETAVVELAARSMAIQSILDEPCLRVSGCSRWPMRKDCGQDCLSQVEAHSPELRLSSAWRSR